MSTDPRIVSATVGPDMLDPDAMAVSVKQASTGALVTFAGVVRDSDRDTPGEVIALEYEAHPEAENILLSLVEGWLEGQGDVAAVAVAHRTGKLYVGEVAFAVSVSSAHRHVAFEACGSLVDLVKEKLPMWKHEIFADATERWVNAP